MLHRQNFIETSRADVRPAWLFVFLSCFLGSFASGFMLTALCPALLFAQQWQTIAPMNFLRTELSAVALPDGRILVAGGQDGSEPLSSCEIYDPATNTWQMTGSMH
ncbi:MAG TPA: kelch repeat-containing protein, partial [Candidatus Kapabacteria bacterium]|nr:kelch repeat-containing protein [Candidatus Kapabacteria bacterium]